MTIYSPFFRNKALPHLVYCRIWRFPQVQSSNELQSVENCLYGFAFKRELICVNPYHYQLVSTSKFELFVFFIEMYE